MRRFAAEAVSIGLDSLSTNGMFLYPALEELRVLREFATCDWRNHPKFNQNIVRHLFETCLSCAVFENRKEGVAACSQDQCAHNRHGTPPSPTQWGCCRNGGIAGEGWSTAG